jgi:hypothetical protein
VTGDGKNLPWVVALGLRIVGQENAERLIEELDEAVASDFHRWQENDSRLARERPQIGQALTSSRDVASFIFDHLLPRMMGRNRPNRGGRRHKVLDLVIALEPDQFVALVIVYADRIGDRDGVNRAFDIFSSASSFHRQHLKAHRKSSEGGHNAANPSKGERATEHADRAVRDQRIRERRDELLKSSTPERNIASLLAKQFELTPTRIRAIIKNTKP